MAGRKRPRWPDRAARVSALESATRHTKPDDERTLGEVRGGLTPDAQVMVDRWLSVLQASTGTEVRAEVCCGVHALRRMYRWLREPEPASIDDLEQIERENFCQ